MMELTTSGIEDAMCRAMPPVPPKADRAKARARLITWRGRRTYRLTLHPLAKTRYMKPIGPRYVHAAFTPIEGAERMTRGVLARAIVQSIAQAYFVTPADLRSRIRTKDLAEARFAICYVIRTTTHPDSTPFIGRLINRDHTTVLHALRQFQKRLDLGLSVNPALKLLPNGWTPPKLFEVTE
ncbi:MAG: helix-turn-helix domain-containing protein [Beijerinckiaceae bacterium]|nr:helix-turn-helix domain-containing protein [Beijerinckiaceae bacterium]